MTSSFHGKSKRLVEWLERVDGHTLLESQVVASGMSAALNELLVAGVVDMVPHPTVKERGGAPAAAVRFAGRYVCECEGWDAARSGRV